MVKICVQIASYRDPQLPTTIASLLANADRPDQFTFGICWQHGPEEDANIYDDNPAFRVFKVPFAKSRGLCWARSITNKLINGEDLTLQIDSHHRFAPSWDTLMLADYASACKLSNMPILTTYLTPFDPENPKDASNVPTIMSQYKFHDNGLLGSMPSYIQNHAQLGGKVSRTRLMSCHFYLVDVSFVKDVPYDDQLYFGGEIEEVSLSVRAWTRGYDFFSPTRDTYCWHEYTRANRPKHWNDHVDWYVQDLTSRERVLHMCGTQHCERLGDLGVYGVGAVRTLAQYEEFIGISFEKKEISKETLNSDEPVGGCAPR
jgi:hypothetical protein